MFEFAKKGLYIGLGLASMTKDKADEFAKEFAKRAKVSEDEGRKFADYLKDESKKAEKDLKKNVEKIVEKTVGKMPCMKKIDALEERIAELEAALKTCCADKAGSDCCADSGKSPEASDQ